MLEKVLEKLSQVYFKKQTVTIGDVLAKIHEKYQLGNYTAEELMGMIEQRGVIIHTIFPHM